MRRRTRPASPPSRDSLLRRVLVLLAAVQIVVVLLPASATGQEAPATTAGGEANQEAEPKPDSEPAEPAPTETTPTGTTPTETTTDTTPMETTPTETTTTETTPSETTPTETTPTETSPTTTTQEPSPSGCASLGTERVATDQSEYALGSMAHITGIGFATSCEASIDITPPDGASAALVIEVETAPDGQLVGDYEVDGASGTYEVRVLGLDGAVLASTTFTVTAEESIPGECAPQGTESIATDKADYAPAETVHMTGAGYAPSCLVKVEVIRPDGSVVKGDGSFEPGADEVRTTARGALAYDYVLNGIEGVYQVRVLGARGAVLATTTFTDQQQVTLCHRTNLRTNPYDMITVSANAAINAHAQNHTGPIFSPDLPAGATWGDIIPPVQPGLPDGLNWTDEGASILANGCELPTPEPLPSAEIGDLECGEEAATVVVTLTNDAAATADATFEILVAGTPQPQVTVSPGGEETVTLDVTAFEDTFVTVEVQSPPGNPIAESTLVVSCQPPPPIGPLPGVEFGAVDCATLTVPLTLTNHEDATADATFAILVNGEVVVEGVTVAPGGSVAEDVDVSAFVGDEVEITVTSPPIVGVHTVTVDCEPGPGLSAASGEVECDGETATVPVTLTNDAAADATFAILANGDVVAEETVAAGGSETVPVNLTAFEDEVVHLSVVSEEVLLLDEFVPVDCAAPPPPGAVGAFIGDVTCSHATSTVTLTNDRAPASEVTFRIFVGGAFREGATVSGGESTTIVVGLGAFEDEQVTIEVRAGGEVLASETLPVDCHGAQQVSQPTQPRGDQLTQPRGDLPFTGAPAGLVGGVGLALIASGLALVRRRRT
jgi:hypothetical protein